MDLIISHSSMIPIYEQLVRQIKTAIAEGRFVAGEALPSVRVLASQLKISALTVKKAYDLLEEEGVLITVHGKGSFVAEHVDNLIAEKRQMEAEKILSEAVEKARLSGYGDEEILHFIELLLEERK